MTRHRGLAASSIGLLVAVVGVTVLTGCSGAHGAGSGPSGSGASGGTTIAVTLTDAGCTASSLTAPAGMVSFHVTGSGSGAVSELEVQRSGRILAERENIVAGLSGDVSVRLDPGSYTLYCPGGSGADSHTFIATAAPASPPASASTVPEGTPT